MMIILKRIKENGGIVVGSTNMDEAAFGGDTSTGFYGRCINPNNKKLSVADHRVDQRLPLHLG